MSVDALAKELGCEVRRFVSVREAMRWRWRRVAHEAPPDAREERGSSSWSEANRDRDNATLAMLSKCLEPADPKVDGFTLHYVGIFPAWSCSYENQRDLARREGMTLSELRRTMRFTENVLENRMRVRGLLA
jgi:hypothetical protein